MTNVQNGKLDTLKNYNISLADYNTRLASNKSSKSDYVENNKPEVMEASAPGNILVVKYAVLVYRIVGVGGRYGTACV